MAPAVLYVTLGMFVLFSIIWAIDVYLLWEDIYVFLPQQQNVIPVPMLRGLLTQTGSGLLYAQRILGNTMVRPRLFPEDHILTRMLWIEGDRGRRYRPMACLRHIRQTAMAV